MENSKDMMENICLMTDSYKTTHGNMSSILDIGYTYGYLEARSGSTFDHTLFCGIQPLLMQIKNFVVTQKYIDFAEIFVSQHIGPNKFQRSMWQHILDNHSGKLPIKIKSVKEGTIVPSGNVLLTIENTDPLCSSLVGHLESFILHVWYPSTVATQSRCVKDIISHYVNLSSNESFPGLAFMLHDFGYRGTSSNESASIGGLAHLLNFSGTDTMMAVLYGMKYYGVNTMIAYSVDASEHSIMTALGRDREFEVIEKLIDDNPGGILSLVLDSYNIYEAICFLCTESISTKIKTRQGKVVIRPDSGNPTEVIPQLLKIIEESGFYEIGFNTVSGINYKLLPPCLGLLWGDGMTPTSIERVLYSAVNGWPELPSNWKIGNSSFTPNLDNCWAAQNFVFGMGGGLLQSINRDTQRFAFKCSANKILSESDSWRPVFKDPCTTEGAETKKSKMGLLKLQKVEDTYTTIQSFIDTGSGIIPNPEFDTADDVLEEVFLNGKILSTQTFYEIKGHVSSQNTVIRKLK
jgi:nicotinamide phosphoribosyltransferase